VETDDDSSCHKLPPRNRGLRWLEGVTLVPSLGQTLPPNLYIENFPSKVAWKGKDFLVSEIISADRVGVLRCFAASVATVLDGLPGALPLFTP
jgi:hypothetical protein